MIFFASLLKKLQCSTTERISVAREELFAIILRTVFQYWLLINLSLWQKISISLP